MKVKKFVNINIKDKEVLLQLIGLKYRLDKNDVLDYDIDDKDMVHIYNMLDYVKLGLPIQYACNCCYFYNGYYYVNDNVLIPRLDSEIVVDTAIKLLKKCSYLNKVLDLCCGSGCLGLSLLKECPDLELTLADISHKALEVTNKNLREISNISNVNVISTNMFSNINSKFDFIISNPPYIKTGDINILDSEVKDHEPYLALNGGNDGMDFYKIIASQAYRFLNNNGLLLIEIGFDQAYDIKQLLKNHFYDIKVIKDLSGNNRCIVAKVKEI